MRNEIRLRAELVKLKIKLKVKNNEELISSDYRNSVVLPRYVRVNTLKTTVEKVIEHLQSEGYVLEEPIKSLNNLSPKTIRRDFHLPDLLILPPNTDLHNHLLYLSGDIILQDKASCFPAHVCSPSIDSYVIDACAAPGNKTSHLSAIMKNTGKIWAIDLDKKRLKLLEKLTQKAGCKNIEAVHGSFLNFDPLDEMYSKVEYVLLDPSCSGSGIVNRLNGLVDSPEQDTHDTIQRSQEERLKNLSQFQEKIILHAFKFPSVKKIVYSTCSIHSQENEQVVKQVLRQTNDFVLANKNDVIPTWDRRGILSEFDDDKESADKLIRTLPEDFTNGFFVACFIRKSSYEENESSHLSDINISNQNTVNTNKNNTNNINSKKRKKKRKNIKNLKKIKDNKVSTTPVSSPLRSSSHMNGTTLNSRTDPIDPFSEVLHLSSPCPTTPTTPQRTKRQVDSKIDLTELIQLETILKCSVCKNFYDVPLSSKCQHTFCAGCAEFDCDNESTGLRCPICKYSFSSFTQFYKNNLINDIIKEYKDNRELIARLYARGQAEERERREGSIKTKETPLKSVTNANNDSTTNPSPVGGTTKLGYTNTEKFINLSDDSNEQKCKRKRMDDDDDDEQLPLSIKCIKSEQPLSKKPKIAYGVMNERKLKSLLKEEGLAANGTKNEMITRHSYFINLYNSNVDATNPKNKGELLREMKRWERARYSDEVKDANLLKKTLTNPEQVDSYAHKYRDQYNELIQQAKRNKKRKEMSSS